MQIATGGPPEIFDCINIISELHYVFQQRKVMQEIHNKIQYF